MGAGDAIMATAQAKRLHANTGKLVVVVGRGGVPVWSEVFENNPKIARAHGRHTARLQNASGMRPYIVAKTPTKWIWKRWAIEPGELYLSAAEKAFSAPYAGKILVEPSTKVPGSNKAWVWERWQQVVDAGGDFIQVGRADAHRLRGVQFVETPTFRYACAVLAVSRAFVGSEGGLGHAAAALGVPAVVLFSAFISPLVTGYAAHRNIYKGPAGVLGCGSRISCDCCRASMEAITVEDVRSAIKEVNHVLL